MNKLGVKFMRPWGVYQAGDRARFDPAQAGRLVNGDGEAMPVAERSGEGWPEMPAEPLVPVTGAYQPPVNDSSRGRRRKP